GYSDKLAACCSCAGGTIGALIPPSIPFIIYGVMTEQSIGKLFMAGVVPGILQALFYIVTIFIWCKTKPDIAPLAPSVPMREKLKTSIGIVPILIILIIMFGGMFSGLFTPTEAGAFSVVATAVVALFMKRLKKDNFKASVKETLMSSCMVFFLIMGAYLFTRFIVLSEIALAAKSGLLYLNEGLGVPAIGIALIIVLFYVIIGFFFDTLAAVLLTVPIVFPVITALGFDPIWWGVITIRVMQMGMISPPFGINIFATSKAIKVPIKTLYTGMWPFIAADVVHVVMLVLIPAISLWLPKILM
ncbi:MAG: TRAP transporter large permease, partial [Clostridiales bacterium]|nr:TRAP transporter large permease [Clostridiales bacterium]